MTTSKFPGWSRDTRRERGPWLRGRIARIGEPAVSYEDMHRAYQDAVVGSKPPRPGRVWTRPPPPCPITDEWIRQMNEITMREINRGPWRS